MVVRAKSVFPTEREGDGVRGTDEAMKTVWGQWVGFSLAKVVVMNCSSLHHTALFMEFFSGMRLFGILYDSQSM